MTNELKSSIEQLYFTFQHYPKNLVITGCPCCVLNIDKEQIHSKELKELASEDLSKYAFKAMTTWGTLEDFKHFLPRIFELLTTDSISFQTFSVLGKLEYGNWKSWSKEEQKAIKDFLFNWWIDLLTNKSYFDNEAFVSIYNLTQEMDTLLKLWCVDFNHSFKLYVDFIHNYYADIIYSKKNQDFQEPDLYTLINWMKINSEKLEQGFFYFENKDENFARQISEALYIFETSLKSTKVQMILQKII